jgi:beta-lactam-binding protein with PASTA domain
MRVASLVAVVFALLAIAVGCGGEESVTVPVLVGLKENVASDFLTKEGLVVEVQRGRGSVVPKGFVYRQSAPEGTALAAGAKLTIWVSSV